MVSGDSPVIREEKLPVPLPLLVFVESAMVGFRLVLQHTPRAVTVAHPELVTFPPLVAVVAVILVTLLVDTTGIFSVVKEFCDP